MEYGSNGNGYNPQERPISYARVRIVARAMEVFTPSALADYLDVTVERAESFVGALLWQGMLEDEVEFVPDGNGGEEPQYTVIPLTKEVYKRNRYTPPEIQAILELFGGFLLYNPRGVTQRLTNKGEKGRIMSTPGARHQQKMRDLAWRRQQEAVHNRAEKMRKRQQAEKSASRRQGVARAVAEMMSGGDDPVARRRERHKQKKAGRKTK